MPDNNKVLNHLPAHSTRISKEIIQVGLLVLFTDLYRFGALERDICKRSLISSDSLA